VDEKDLTEKQRDWLALSRKIGPGAMTKTERESLDKAYAEMLPKEQQDLYNYIMTTYHKEESEEPQTGSKKEDPISEMEKIIWRTPSHPLRSALSKAQNAKPWSSRNRS
jgi:hypothetical protein